MVLLEDGGMGGVPGDEGGRGGITKGDGVSHKGSGGGTPTVLTPSLVLSDSSNTPTSSTQT